jgi:hypothetical protein
MAGTPVTIQTPWYAPIANAFGKAVREKRRPTLAAKRSSADPYTQASRQGLPGAMECHIGAWRRPVRLGHATSCGLGTVGLSLLPTLSI